MHGTKEVTYYPSAREKWISAAVKACRSAYLSPGDARFGPAALSRVESRSQRVVVVCEPTDEGPPIPPLPPALQPLGAPAEIIINGVSCGLVVVHGKRGASALLYSIEAAATTRLIR